MKRQHAPSPAATWMALLASIPLLGGCGNLQSLPTPPGNPSQAPAIPGPFENYDPARPPQYKRAPDPAESPRKQVEEPPPLGGVLRPSQPRPKKDRQEDGTWDGLDDD